MKLLEVAFRDTKSSGYSGIGEFDASRSIQSQIVELAQRTLDEFNGDGPYPRKLDKRSITYLIFDKE